jgi:hypothetical protein
MSHDLALIDGIAAAQRYLQLAKTDLATRFRRPTHTTALIRRFEVTGSLMTPRDDGRVREIELSVGTRLRDQRLFDGYVRAQFAGEVWSVSPSIELLDEEAVTLWQGSTVISQTILELAGALADAAQQLVEALSSPDVLRVVEADRENHRKDPERAG